jgi:hypothetical protein
LPEAGPLAIFRELSTGAEREAVWIYFGTTVELKQGSENHNFLYFKNMIFSNFGKK